MTRSVDAVLADIDDILARARPGAVRALATIVAAPRRPDQAYGCLELWYMQRYELTYNAFCVRGGKLDVEYACLPGFAGEDSFVPELADYFAAIATTLNWSEGDGEQFTTRHERQVLAWFASCWREAGGAAPQVPTYFCFEKEYRVQDILSGEVLEEEEAARRLGHAL